MQVIIADAIGLCFGVRDALAAVRSVPAPVAVTVFGELVHNPLVSNELNGRGFAQRAEVDRDTVPDTPVVLITAHGISDRRRRQLLEAGKTLIDTTCPLVRHVHQAAQQLHDDGCRVLIVGRRDHVEVRGVVEDLDHHSVIESPDDVRTWPDERLGVVCQSTSAAEEVEQLHQLIVARNPQASIRFIDTVCRPTRERQQALAHLLPLVDAMVVVGGANSNNTRRLADRARAAGKPTFAVQHAGELREEWFAGCRTLGLTAGTSTLDGTIEEVRGALEAIPGVAAAA